MVKNAHTENPLESLSMTILFSSRDWGQEKRDAWVYGIVCGWDENCREESNRKFGWSNETFDRLQRLNARFEEMLCAEENKPLTLDELRQMAGEPVYLVFDYMPEQRNGWYEFLRVVNGKYLEFRGWEILLEQLGRDVIAYRRNPKEEV